MERGVAGPEPAQGGELPRRGRSELLSREPQEGLGRQDAAFADQPVQLHGERQERDGEDHPEEPHEQPARQPLAWRDDVPAPDHACHAVEQLAPAGDPAIAHVARPAKRGNALVEREPGPVAGGAGQGAERGLGAAAHAAVGLDQVDRAAKLLGRDLGKAGGRFLIGRVLHALAGDRAPARDPRAAERALAVPYEDGALRPFHADSGRSRRCLLRSLARPQRQRRWRTLRRYSGRLSLSHVP